MENILPLTILESDITDFKSSNSLEKFIEIEKYTSQKCHSYSFHRPISKVKIF